MDAIRSRAAARNLPSEAHLRAAATALRTLGHAKRLCILRALAGQELCVCDLSKVLGTSMSVTSQHLKELRNLGAVTYRSAGKLAYYRLAEDLWSKVADSVIDDRSWGQRSGAAPKAAKTS